MDKWINRIKQLPWYIKNIYSAILIFFIVWMLFFDSYNAFTQLKLSRKLAKLENQKTYFIKEIEELKLLKEELFSTSEKKEKFAREMFFMKKDNEDVFIIVEE